MPRSQPVIAAMNEAFGFTPDIAAVPAPDDANDATPSGKKRGRKNPVDTLKALEAKQAQLDARIKKEKAKIRTTDRKLDTRRKIVAGAIALEHMEHDENFRNVMEGLIKRHTKDNDKALFDL